MERKQSENESFDFRVDVLLAIIQQIIGEKGIKRRESEITHNM